MISSAGAMRGLSARCVSHGCGSVGMRRCETLKPLRPAFGLPPRPVAPSSRISPPAPVTGAGERRDRGRMVVRLDLDAERARGGVLGAVFVRLRIGAKALRAVAFDDGGVVAVRRQRVLRRLRVRVLDHLEQRRRLLASVDGPGGVEDLVAAMLGVGLREHHQFDVAADRARVRRSAGAGSRSRPAASASPRRVLAASSCASGMRSSAPRAGVANSAAAASRSASSDCVIGSCSSFDNAACAGAAAGQPGRSMRVPRSTRFTGRPAPRSNSVALLAQGEIVPSRGSTKREIASVSLRRDVVAGLQDAVQRGAVRRPRRARVRPNRHARRR